MLSAIRVRGLRTLRLAALIPLAAAMQGCSLFDFLTPHKKKQAKPSIVVSASAISFSSTRGESDPTSQIVQITNGTTGTLSGLIASTTYASGETAGWLTSSVDAPSAPTNLVLRVRNGSLLAGAYHARVSITSADATNSPQGVDVTFTVHPAAASIAIATGTVSFSAPKGAANPSPQQVLVTNSGESNLTGLAATISYSSGQPSGWLNASLSSSAAPSTLTLSVALGNLDVGTYGATVVLSSGIAKNSPIMLPVSLTVSPPVPVTQTFYASADNLLQLNSADVSKADQVFEHNELAVGTSYFYTIIDTYEFLAAASVMKFDVQPVISGKTILQATLRLFEYQVPGDFRGQFRVSAIKSAWSPSTITWNRWINSVQHYEDGSAAFSAIASTIVPLDVDVTTIVRNWASGAFINNGIQLWEPFPSAPGFESYQLTTIQSLDVYTSSTRRPQLIIRYY